MAETNGNGRIKVDPAIALQIVAWIVGVMLVYGAVNARVSVLETKYDALKESLTLINLKLDRIMEQK
ncbi:MAG TPA: hypothetical protein VN903_25790 [Polyangia bacterium]|nr:hypothetical protein [Polyangia bacterium]